jgi:hypothetical protein
LRKTGIAIFPIHGIRKLEAPEYFWRFLYTKNFIDKDTNVNINKINMSVLKKRKPGLFSQCQWSRDVFLPQNTTEHLKFY